MKGFIVYPTYRIVDNKAFVHLFGRLENGESFQTINLFKPYFYIKTKDKNKAEKYNPVDTKLQNFNGEPVSKVILDLPKDVPEVRNALAKDKIQTYEADIRFVYRFMIDKGLKGSVEIKGSYTKGDFVGRIYEEPELKPIQFTPRLKVISIDIESSMDLKEIYCVSLYSKDFSKVLIVNKRTKNAETVKNEKELIERFKAIIQDYDPDIITGWNLIDFDIKLLKEKFDQHKIAFVLGRTEWPGSIKIFDSFFRESSVDIAGRMVLDGMNLLKTSFIGLSDYKLQTAAQEILGESKLNVFEDLDKGEEIERLYQNEPEKLVEYNLHDSRLVYKILEKKGIIDLTVQRSILTGMQLDRVRSSIASLDNLYIREAKKLGYVCQTGDYKERDARIKGGYVKDPTPGIYDNIVVLDFKSLYPSIIRTFNIDPLAFIPIELHKKYKDYIEAPNGARFKKEGGILPKIIHNLWEKRDLAKKKNNSEESYAIKISMNCFSEESQILTARGIEYIKDVKIDDLVYTFDPKTEDIKLKPISKIFKYQYNDNLIKVTTNHVDYLVTPNHRFLINNGKEYVWKEVFEMSQNLIRGWLPEIKKIKGDVSSVYNLQKKCNQLKIKYILKGRFLQKERKHSSVPRQYKIENWLTFLGWYISEGDVCVSSPKQYKDKVSWSSVSYKISLSQEEESYRKEILGLLDDMGFKYSVMKKSIEMSNQIIAEVLLKEIGHSRKKRIPNWIFSLDHSLLKYLFDTMMKGNGDSNGQRYSTSNLLLAQDFLRLLFHLGLKGTIYSEQLRESSIYRIQINRVRGIKPYLSKYRNFSTQKYKGNVYCVEVPPHHTIIAGRNNKLNICGQSFFGVLANPMCRFYSIDMANAITHFSQFIIKQTAQLVEKEGYRVIYGDTDSIFLDTKADSDNKATQIGNDISRYVNEFWNKYIKEEYGVRSYLELEYEKTYLRFLMPKIRGTEKGAKKRYAGLLFLEGKEKLEFTGLEFVRRDWTELSKKFQYDLLDRIFHKKKVVDYMKEFINNLKSGKYDDLLIYKKAIRKDLEKYVKTTPPHVKAARKLDKISSSIIAYVMTTDGPEPLQKLTHSIDYEHYIDKQIKPIADSILVFYNKTFDEIINNIKQTSLSKFS